MLGLQEIKKYWRINNHLLDLFLQYLDVSIAKRLHGEAMPDARITAPERADAGVAPDDGEGFDFPTPAMQAQSKAFEDQYFNVLYGPWEGEDGLADLGLVLQADEPMQVESLNFLGRSL